MRKLYDYISLYEYVSLLGLIIAAVAGLNTYIASIIVFQILMKIPFGLLKKGGYKPIDSLYKNLSGSKKSINKRPSDAFNCDAINQGGDYSKVSGFPSGHSSVATYLFFVVLLEYIDKKTTPSQRKSLLPLLSITFLFQILVPLARYKSHCHTIPQIVGGITLGIITAVIFKYIENEFMINNERYRNDKQKVYNFLS
jgi:membrane-associated phospholipid phosphatase